MGYSVNIESSIGVSATYAKLANLTIENADKQYITAIFQMYSSKENRDAGLKPFPDMITINLELEKDFEGNIRKKIYEVAKEKISTFAEAEVI